MENKRQPSILNLQSSILNSPSGSAVFFQGTVPVTENIPLARLTYRIRLHCPELAHAIRPGQFIMVRQPETNDPLLGRPFALYDTVLDVTGKPIGIDVVYLVIGKLTGLLADMKAV